MRLRIGDQLRHRFHRQRIGHEQNESGRCDLRDRSEILSDIVRKILHERWRDAEVAHRPHEDRVAIGFGARHRLHADHASGAGLVLDHDGLPEISRHLGRDDPRDRVDGAARRKTENDMQRTGRK